MPTDTLRNRIARRVARLITQDFKGEEVELVEGGGWRINLTFTGVISISIRSAYSMSACLEQGFTLVHVEDNYYEVKLCHQPSSPQPRSTSRGKRT